MNDLAAAVLAAIAERRPVAQATEDRWGGVSDGFALANLDAWEAVVREHPVFDVTGTRYGCRTCGRAWPCPTIRAAARLFLTAEQLAEYGVEPVPA